MLEQVALSDAIKTELLDLEASLGKVDLFTLLGVPKGADPDTVKKAYFALSRRIHPDRYFRKTLGSFKARIDKVFDAVRKAHQTLTDPVKRERYLAAHPSLRAAPALKWKPGQRIMFNKKDFPVPGLAKKG